MSTYEKLTRSLQALSGTTVMDLLWYLLLAGSLWLFYSVLFNSRFRHRKVLPEQPKRNQMRRELFCSLRSIAIFGVVTAAVVYLAYDGWTRLYLPIDRFGWWWFFTSIFLMIVLHDTYFYWTHRLMHLRGLYRHVHHTHHRSTSPTPWAAYSFSSLEAFVQAGIGPLIVLTIPTHPAAFAIFMGWQIAFNVFGHCGYEIFPKWFIRSPAGYLLNSVTHHTLHHEKYRTNYGLYFNVWDRLMGTNHADYQERFELATGPRRPTDSQTEEVFDPRCIE